jgi:hypothetical protein
MNLEAIFGISNLVVVPFWALMILLPHWRWTRRAMAGIWPVMIPAVIYAILILPQIGSVFGALASPTLGGIATLLGAPSGAAIGWAHFLAFDLFVGRWAYLDSRERRLTAWLASPALFLIFMVGPLGLLIYWTVSRLMSLVVNRS